MPGPLARSPLLLALPLAIVLAVAGVLAVSTPGRIGLLVIAALVGASAAGMVREMAVGASLSAVDVGVRTAGWAAGALFVLAGIGALAGGVVAGLAGLLGLVVAVLAVRRRRVGSAAASAVRRGADRRPPEAVRAGPPDGSMLLLLPPVGGLTAEALGQEWLRTTAVLATRLDPLLQRAIVARRAAVLDELERRDPAGFRRWLGASPLPGGNPSEYVRDLPAAGAGAA